MLGKLLSRLRRARRPPLALVLYTKRDCPLCDEMKHELGRARVPFPFRLTEVDIEREPELLARHGRSLPVLEIAGRVAFKGRLTAADLERRLARAWREAP
jgi:glutaredoxin